MLAPGRRTQGSFVFLAAAHLLVGCSTISSISSHDVVVGPSYQPSNVYCGGSQLPKDLKRVAVLPLTAGAALSDAAAGTQTLEPVLVAELGKARKFDRVVVTPEELRHWTGHRFWRAGDTLPSDFLAKIRQHTGCEGVLFCELSQFKPYGPVMVGWKLSLVDCRDAQICWSVDEVFDARETAVANAARRYFLKHRLAASPHIRSESILSSPRRFGHYAACAVLDTLPER